MGIYRSESEEIWYECIELDLDDSQISLLNSSDPSYLEDKMNLISYINSQSKKDPGIEKTSELNSFYRSIISSIEMENYEFISMDLSDNDSVFSGILNYRINNQHRQKRF